MRLLDVPDRCVKGTDLYTPVDRLDYLDYLALPLACAWTILNADMLDPCINLSRGGKLREGKLEALWKVWSQSFISEACEETGELEAGWAGGRQDENSNSLEATWPVLESFRIG